MRSILLLFVVLIVTPSALILPHLGVLVWSWISIMNPHRLSWGITNSIPLVMVIACVTMAAWLLSREPKTPPSRLLIWAAVAFVIHMTISSFSALHPEYSWLLWDQTLKTFALFFVAATLINSRVRIQSLLWIIAISLGFYATKGVMDTLSSGGKTVLMGPAYSMLTDNNHLALALVVLLPILNYLRITSANKMVKLGLILVIVFTIAAVITSYSRGGLITLAIAGIALLKSGKGKILVIALLASVSFLVIGVMPQKWKDRVFTLESVESIQEDDSFSGRTDAWYVSWQLANDRPLTGGGFRAIEYSETFLKYLPDAVHGRAAHSIYFQVLGDHGYPGLILYLLMLAAAWFHLRRTQTRARAQPEIEWAGHLARMLQISLLCFMVGGAALSVAYHDLILLLLIVAMNADIISEKKIVAEPKLFLPANQRYDPQMQ